MTPADPTRKALAITLEAQREAARERARRAVPGQTAMARAAFVRATTAALRAECGGGA